MKSRDNTPTQPLPPTHASKLARIPLKKAPVHRAAPAETTKRGEVRSGALLDPFGQDD